MTVSYSLKTKGRGGMEVSEKRKERDRLLKSMTKDLKRGRHRARDAFRVSPIAEESESSGEEERRSRSPSSHSDSKEYKDEKGEESEDEDEYEQPSRRVRRDSPLEEKGNETLNDFLKETHQLDSNEEVFKLLTNSEEMRKAMNKTSPDLRGQAEAMITAINAKVWKAQREKMANLSFLIKHLAKECHLCLTRISQSEGNSR
jgi:hypothetical protein